MATFKSTGGVSHFRDKLIAGMVDHGLSREFAARTFKQLEGFGSYGFPMSHAASFAKIAYISSWAKCRHPDLFLAALLNAQPMGFYAPAQLVSCARNHGVEVRPVDVNHSRWDCTIEEPSREKGWRAIRLGLRMVSGFGEVDAARLVGARMEMPFADPEELQLRAGLTGRAVAQLVDADAFGSCTMDRRAAGWHAAKLRDHALPLFAEEWAAPRDRHEAGDGFAPAPMTQGREVVEDYLTTGLSLKAHPVSFIRPALHRKGCRRAADVLTLKDRIHLRVAGLVLARQRPGSAKGVMFMTLEDETGPMNIIVWPNLFQKYRRIVLTASMIGVEGQLQREGDVRHIITHRLVDLSGALARVGEQGPVEWRTGRGDEARHGGGPDARGIVPARGGAQLTRAVGRPGEADNVRSVPSPPLAGQVAEHPLKLRPRNFR